MQLDGLPIHAVFEPRASYDYLSYEVVSRHERPEDRFRSRRPLADEWEPVTIVPILDEEPGYEVMTKECDFPIVIGATGLMIFSEHIKSQIADAFNPYGEFLPLIVRNTGQVFHVFHTMNEVDAIDRANSDMLLARDCKRILAFHRIVLDPERLIGQHIFTLRSYSPIKAFISDAVRGLIQDAGCTGFKPEEIWRSESVDSL